MKTRKSNRTFMWGSPNSMLFCSRTLSSYDSTKFVRIEICNYKFGDFERFYIQFLLLE